MIISLVIDPTPGRGGAKRARHDRGHGAGRHADTRDDQRREGVWPGEGEREQAVHALSPTGGRINW
jgi:hypothetical protein